MNILFHREKNQTQIQKLTVYKNLDTQIIEIVELFLLMIQGVDVEKRQNVLNEIDESLWQILTLWFFDCM